MLVRLAPSIFVVLLCVACTGHSARSGPPSLRGDGRAGPGAHATVSQLRWIGGPTTVIERAGMRVITDPMLGPRAEQAFVLPRHPSSGQLNAPIARYTAPPALALDTLDAILISHTHADHFDAYAKQHLPKALPMVVAKAGAESVRAAGFSDVRALDWGESATIAVRGARLRVTAVPAHHAHEAELDHELGRGNGYVLEWLEPAAPYRVYWTGDAVLSDDSKTLVQAYGAIDLLLPHMGGVGGDGGLGLRTMNALEAIELVRRLVPRLVVPIHHTTFAHYREPIEALQQRAVESGEAQRFRFMREGDTAPL